MSISESAINRIVQLAHLSMDSDTVSRLSEQIRDIMGHISALNDATVDADDSGDIVASTPTRPDDIDAAFGDCFSVNSTYQQGPFYVVPRIAGTNHS